MSTNRKKEIEDYYDLVHLVVNKILKKNPFYREYKDDLISEGTLGLINSIGTYRAHKGSSKVTYYSRGIRNYISNYLKRLSKDSHTLVYIDSIEDMHLVDEEQPSVESSLELYEELKPRDYINRRIYEGNVTGMMTLSELSEELGISYTNLHQRKKRMLARMKKIMEGDYAS